MLQRSIWGTLAVRGAAATLLNGPLAEVVNLCTHGRQIAPPVRRAELFFFYGGVRRSP